MSDNINIYMPMEISLILAAKERSLRLQYRMKQATLAEKSGVPAISIRRFESTGKISLSSLLKIAGALGCLDGFLALFPPHEAGTMAELEKLEGKKSRQRGTL
ncbi:MAG: helix-turn-helix transcriptional regulator [Victivallales bacterium]